MLLTIFLILGCLAFFLIIVAFIPLTARLTIVLWFFTFLMVIPYVDAGRAAGIAAIIAGAGGWYLFKNGTYQEQQAKKKAEAERVALVEMIRREQSSLPPALAPGKEQPAPFAHVEMLPGIQKYIFAGACLGLMAAMLLASAR